LGGSLASTVFNNTVCAAHSTLLRFEIILIKYNPKRSIYKDKDTKILNIPTYTIYINVTQIMVVKQWPGRWAVETST